MPSAATQTMCTEGDSRKRLETRSKTSRATHQEEMAHLERGRQLDRGDCRAPDDAVQAQTPSNTHFLRLRSNVATHSGRCLATMAVARLMVIAVADTVAIGSFRFERSAFHGSSFFVIQLVRSCVDVLSGIRKQEIRIVKPIPLVRRADLIRLAEELATAAHKDGRAENWRAHANEWSSVIRGLEAADLVDLLVRLLPLCNDEPYTKGLRQTIIAEVERKNSELIAGSGKWLARVGILLALVQAGVAVASLCGH